MRIERVCVYCASSQQADSAYREAAFRLGQVLAAEGITIVYGGGGHGSMGALADGALSQGGKVIGILPRFMDELEWSHRGVSELVLVENMHQRKHLMLSDSDAVVALPGGCGTLEELFEAMTLKRLGIYVRPIVLLNTKNFFDPCIALLQHCIAERFMDDRHGHMWSVALQPEDVLPAVRNCRPWSEKARTFAVMSRA